MKQILNDKKEVNMDLREKFKKENGYGVMAVRQDYAGQTPYEDGFCDEYVEWLEAKVKNLSVSIVSQRSDMKQILNDKKEVIFEGDATEMTLAFNYLTKPFYILAETMGLRMSDAYELNKKYWNDKTRNAKSFELIDV